MNEDDIRGGQISWPPLPQSGRDPDGVLLKPLKISPVLLYANGRRIIVSIEVEEVEADQVSLRHATLLTQRRAFPFQDEKDLILVRRTVYRMIEEGFYYCAEIEEILRAKKELIHE